jgi:hypothetical protein
VASIVRFPLPSFLLIATLHIHHFLSVTILYSLGYVLSFPKPISRFADTEDRLCDSKHHYRKCRLVWKELESTGSVGIHHPSHHVDSDGFPRSNLRMLFEPTSKHRTLVSHLETRNLDIQTSKPDGVHKHCLCDPFKSTNYSPV